MQPVKQYPVTVGMDDRREGHVLLQTQKDRTTVRISMTPKSAILVALKLLKYAAMAGKEVGEDDGEALR
jgi:hypothetical protein